MDYMDTLRKYARHPIPHQLLVSLFSSYQKPNDKILKLIREGWLKSVKKGLYMAGERLHSGSPEPLLLANHLLGPSYVSHETALAHYGIIPERVYEIASMTTKASRKFTTPLGTFSFRRLPLPYYAFGIDQVKLTEDQFVMVATPEKALCDKIITTPGLVFRSKSSMREFLLENLRSDESRLRQLSTTAIASWLPDSPKNKSLMILIQVLQEI